MLGSGSVDVIKYLLIFSSNYFLNIVPTEQSGDCLLNILVKKTALYCFLISLLWGCTNSLIKKSTAGITRIKVNNPVYRFINEVKYLVANWKYILLFCINQLGSLLYFLLLQSVDLSLIIPAVNALTFIVTGFFGFLTGEDAPGSRTFLGLILILTGISFCVLDKVHFKKANTE